MHVSDNSNLSQEIFAIDTWGAVICSLGHGRKHMLTILPNIWRPGFKDNCFIIEIFDKCTFSGILRGCSSHLNEA